MAAPCSPHAASAEPGVLGPGDTDPPPTPPDLSRCLVLNDATLLGQYFPWSQAAPLLIDSSCRTAAAALRRAHPRLPMEGPEARLFLLLKREELSCLMQ